MPAPAPEELNEFIDDPMAEKLKALSQVVGRIRRRNRNLLTLLFILFFIPSTCAATLWLATDETGTYFEPTFSVLLAPVGTLLAFALLYLPLRYRFVIEEIPFEYVADMVVPVVHYIDPRLDFKPRGSLSREDFQNSGLPCEDLRKFRSAPGFAGTIRGMELRLGYIEAPTFEGLLALAEFEFPLKEADLSPELQEIAAQRDATLHIHGNTLYFAIEAEDYFEQPSSQPIADTGHLHRVGRDLSAFLEVVERREREG